MILRQAQEERASEAPEGCVIVLPSAAFNTPIHVPILAQTRGYGVVYHAGDSNRCPSCHGRSWHVGRTTAECATCHTALPIVTDGRGA